MSVSTSKPRFSNQQPERHDMVKAVVKWLRGAPNRMPAGPLPTVSPEFEQSAQQRLGATWFGHSTVLVELDEVMVLTDPVWSPRASPTKCLGPRRFFEPVLALEEMPAIDVVLISHDHYDHLDRRACRFLAARGSSFLVPRGVASRLEAWGVDPSRITELGWWDEVELSGLRFVCTPARHFSGRGLTDRNRSLWGGWAILGERERVFFSGDSGMGGHFEQIGDRLGPFDLTLMESGAYDAAWADVHMGPEQAVLANRLVGGRLMLPIHWGLFNLALHAWTEPVERVQVAAADSSTRIVVPRPGERFFVDGEIPTRQWWPALAWESAETHPIVSSGDWQGRLATG